MLSEIMPGLYRIESPLTGNPLRSINSYVIPGKDHCLLVDAGLNRDECDQSVKDGLKALGIDMTRLWFVATHLHADHIGLMWRWAAEHNAPARFLIGTADGEHIGRWQGWDQHVASAAAHGFPPESLAAAIQAHPGYRFKAPDGFRMEYLNDGDILDCGGYSFQCIATPGHSRGHTCLYEASRRLLISGDHILGDITPNIEGFMNDCNPLKDYLDSLEKVQKLEVNLVLPGHRSPIKDMPARIDGLRAHHQQRLAEVLDIIGTDTMHAYEIAARMTWDLDCADWESFPSAQKWFAIGEAIAHLRYLDSTGELESLLREGIIHYRQ